jgi:hypothetical protein
MTPQPFASAVKVPVLMWQAAVKHLHEDGSVINIGSGVSRLTPGNSTIYTDTKGALKDSGTLGFAPIHCLANSPLQRPARPRSEQS